VYLDSEDIDLREGGLMIEDEKIDGFEFVIRLKDLGKYMKRLRRDIFNYRNHESQTILITTKLY